MIVVTVDYWGRDISSDHRLPPSDECIGSMEHFRRTAGNSPGIERTTGDIADAAEQSAMPPYLLFTPYACSRANRPLLGRRSTSGTRCSGAECWNALRHHVTY
jgi:hypothetical protein